MALPTILFNSSGSDTQASGAGPSTAIFGTGAECDGTANVDLSADSPDLSGVATDGSAVLWVDTATGRQFSAITAVDNGTKIVTVANAYSASAAGLTWAIGGKRATFDNADSRKLFTADVLPGWVVETETDQNLTTTAIGSTGAPCPSGSSAVGWITLKGASGTRPIITQGANNSSFVVGSYWRIEHLQFANSNVTKTIAIGIQIIGATRIRDCVFGHATNTLLQAVTRGAGTPTLFMEDCEVFECTSTTLGKIRGGSMSCMSIFNCWIHDNAGPAIECITAHCFIEGNLIVDNDGDGIACTDTTTRTLVILDNTIDGNGGDGIDLSTAQATGDATQIKGNILSNNANYGIRGPATETGLLIEDFNDFYNNTSGARLNVTAGANSLALDPQFTDAAGDDYSIGANLKAAGWPGTSRTIGGNGTATYSHRDMGAAQREEPAGGGGAVHCPVVGNGGIVIRGLSL